MSGKFCLDQHFARLHTASRTTCDLHECLRKPFRTAEVGAEQALIGVQHDDQRYIGEVVALGDHLGPDEDPCLAGRHAFHGGFHVAAPPDHISIEPDERYAGKHCFQRLLDALGALSDGLHDKTALWATRWQWFVGAAVMTPQTACGEVHGHACVAFLARRDPTTRCAQQRWRVASAIEKYQHLTVFVQVALHRLNRGRRDSRLDGVDAQIDEYDSWRHGLRRPTR